MAAAGNEAVAATLQLLVVVAARRHESSHFHCRVTPRGRAGAMLALGTPLVSNAFLIGGLALPFLISGFVARYWPLLRNYLSAGSSAASAAWHSRGAEGAAWDAEWVGGAEQRGAWGRGGSGGQQQQRQEDWQQQWQRMWQQQQQRQRQGQQQGQQGQRQRQRQQQWQQQAPHSSRDPKGYYRELGVAPDATQSEVGA
jgi:hypothetical protein